MNVTAWGGLADEVCALWKEVVEARVRGENPRRIEDLNTHCRFEQGAHSKCSEE